MDLKRYRDNKLMASLSIHVGGKRTFNFSNINHWECDSEWLRYTNVTIKTKIEGRLFVLLTGERKNRSHDISPSEFRIAIKTRENAKNPTCQNRLNLAKRSNAKLNTAESKVTQTTVSNTPWNS